MGYHSQSAQKAPKAPKALKKDVRPQKTQSAVQMQERQNDAFPILAVVQTDVW